MTRATKAGFKQATVRTAAPELSMAVGSRRRVTFDDYLCGWLAPGAVHSPSAFNLQAYARAGGGHAARRA